jgi:formate hydrogenlyase subunit 4
MNLAAMAPVLGHVLALLVLPFVLHGLVNRVKSLWSGRKGPPILQLAFDVQRLLRKHPVYSRTATPLFRIAPWVFLVTALASAAICPLLGSAPLVAFPGDFVWFAYVYGLGRVAMLLAALDTGSPFEGMGAAREALFAALLEPALFLVVGALCAFTGSLSLHEALLLPVGGGASVVVLVGSVVALLVVLQVETGRMPVDDPATHLELTMVHEVMVLDHSGPDLAAIQYTSALKLFVGASVVATLLNPWAGTGTWAAAGTNLLLTAGVAVVVGSIESLVARLRLRAVPKYIAVALGAAAVALLATAWREGGGG